MFKFIERIDVIQTGPFNSLFAVRDVTVSWEAIGAIGEVAGAFGVILTLIYLAIQLRQNTKASQITAVQNSVENSARFSELVAEDDHPGRTFWVGLSNPEELNASEMRKFISIVNVFMRRGWLSDSKSRI